MAWIAMEPGGLTALGRPHVVESRMPHDGAGDEVAVDEELARDAALRLGDRYPRRLYAADQAGISLDAVVAPRSPARRGRRPRGGATPGSSSRKGDRRVRPASAATRWRPPA